MKQAIKNHMLMTGGVYYTWYRFSQKSNYITFKQWVEEYVDNLKPSEVEHFVQRNRLSEV